MIQWVAEEILFHRLKGLSSGLIPNPQNSLFNAELHSILAAQYESWWESREDTAGGGRLTAAKPQFGWLSLEWSTQHRWSCYLLLPRVAKMKLLKLLKIHLMSKRLAGGSFPCSPLSGGSHLVDLELTCMYYVCMFIYDEWAVSEY